MRVEHTRASDFAEQHASDRLLARLGRRCRHASAVLGPDAEWWREALSRHAGDVIASFTTPPAMPGRFKTVLATAANPTAPLEDIAARAAAAWALVTNGGRLFVVAVNGDALRPRTGVTMRELKRRLRPLAPPVFHGDQPFMWIVAELRKRRSIERPPASRMERYDTTAALCAGDVIELGCGTGDLAALIAAHGHRVVGVDLNAPKIDDARRRYPAVDFHCADIVDLDWPDAVFDTAVLAEVLEHVPDDVGAQMLERGWRLLRPGGRLIVSVPNEDLVPHRNHIRQFSVGSLSRLLRAYGKPVLATEQPFKWILAHVEKP